MVKSVMKLRNFGIGQEYIIFDKEIYYRMCTEFSGSRGGLRNSNIGQSTKFKQSLIRTKKQFIQRALLNFGLCDTLSFLTLTFKENISDLKITKRKLASFFQQLRNKYNGVKYCYVYEYQSRGAVHFHILLNSKISNKFILKYWPYGLNKNILCDKNTNQYLILYLAKYLSKSWDYSVKTSAAKDLNKKLYSFSLNCDKVQVQDMDYNFSSEEFIQFTNSFYYRKDFTKEKGDKKLWVMSKLNSFDLSKEKDKIDIKLDEAEFFEKYFL